jgi:uncharacterized protein YeaO (DUF488 family)
LAVKTKSIYQPAEPGDGVRVLITRYYPRGVRKDRFDRWIKPLSPSRELLWSYKKAGQKNWDQFRESFLSELRGSPEGIEALRELAALGQLQDVTLLCYEKEGLPCHRHAVRDVLTSPESLSRFLGGRPDDSGKTAVKARRPPKAPGSARTRDPRIRSSSSLKP